MTDLAWYWKRLIRMSVPEVGYRLNQSLRTKMDRRRFAQASAARGPTSRIHIPVMSREDLVARSTDFRDAAVEQARVAAEHRFTVFGDQYDFGAEINWHLDPHTGNVWPHQFWGDIDYRDGASVGGIKFAWELNRLHHLPYLAISYALTGDESLRREFFAQVAAWVDDNPYPIGINWISGIELGIRIVNLFFAVRFLGDRQLSDEELALLAGFFVRHAEHLMRYPSKYSSCANHALAEALGLFVAGHCCPDHRRARDWREFGRVVLEREVTRQIHPDGGSFEHSIPYLPFIVDHFLIYRLVCEIYGAQYGEAVDERIAASVDFLASLTDRAGNFPHIGDDDDGFLLRLGFDGVDTARSLRNTAALLYDRAQWLCDIEHIDARSVLLLDADAGERWGDLKRRAGNLPERQVRYFPDAGIALFRSNKSGREMLFAGNSGPLGLEPLAGHGHADALSIWLSVDGQPLLIDPGTYLYHGGGEWRTYFRSTKAHNTVRVDGVDQAEIIADFMFDQPYPIAGGLEEDRSGVVRWWGRQEGYRRLADPVTHEREVQIAGDGVALDIVDTIEAAGRHEVECCFHFHPQCDVRLEEGRVVIRTEHAGLTMDIDPQWGQRELFRGARDPVAGWYSSSFGRLEQAPTLVLRSTTHGTTCFRSRIAVVLGSRETP